MALDSLLQRIPPNRDFIRRLAQRSLRGTAIGAGLAFVVMFAAWGFFGYIGGFVLLKAIDSVAKDLGASEGHYLSYPMVGGGVLGLIAGLVSALVPPARKRIIDG